MSREVTVTTPPSRFAAFECARALFVNTFFSGGYFRLFSLVSEKARFELGVAERVAVAGALLQWRQCPRE